MSYCTKCKGKPGYIIIERKDGEVVGRLCGMCRTPVDYDPIPKGGFHENIWQKVERHRGHLKNYKRDSLGKY